MNNVLRNILKGENIQEIISDVKDNIFRNGGVSGTDMEILSLLSLYWPQEVQKEIDEILMFLALYFKDGIEVNSLKSKIFEMYRDAIRDKYGKTFTPVQADIYQGIGGQHYFSFSAPTSTGKSYVLHSFIKDCDPNLAIKINNYSCN